MRELWRKIFADNSVKSFSKYCCIRWHASIAVMHALRLMDISVLHVIEPIISDPEQLRRRGIPIHPLKEKKKKKDQSNPSQPTLLSIRFDIHTVTPTRHLSWLDPRSPNHHSLCHLDLPKNIVYPFLLETGMLPSKISLPSHRRRLAPHKAKSLTTLSLSSSAASSPSFCRRISSHEQPKQTYSSKRTPKD